MQHKLRDYNHLTGIKMTKTRNQYTTELKQECVNLIVNQHYSVAQAAKAMQVGLSTPQRWLGQYRQEI